MLRPRMGQRPTGVVRGGHGGGLRGSQYLAPRVDVLHAQPLPGDSHPAENLGRDQEHVSLRDAFSPGTAPRRAAARGLTHFRDRHGEERGFDVYDEFTFGGRYHEGNIEEFLDLILDVSTNVGDVNWEQLKKKGFQRFTSLPENDYMTVGNATDVSETDTITAGLWHTDVERLRGRDPYDALAGRRVPAWVRSHARLRQVAIQLRKRMPIETGGLLGVEPFVMAKTVGCALAAAARYGDSDAVPALTGALEATAGNLGGGAFGYEFDVQTRWAFYPAGSPNLIATVFVARGLARYRQCGILAHGFVRVRCDHDSRHAQRTY